jgi:hypothetical protein
VVREAIRSERAMDEAQSISKRDGRNPNVIL